MDWLTIIGKYVKYRKVGGLISVSIRPDKILYSAVSGGFSCVQGSRIRRLSGYGLLIRFFDVPDEMENYLKRKEHRRWIF